MTFFASWACANHDCTSTLPSSVSVSRFARWVTLFKPMAKFGEVCPNTPWSHSSDYWMLGTLWRYYSLPLPCPRRDFSFSPSRDMVYTLFQSWKTFVARYPLPVPFSPLFPSSSSSLPPVLPSCHFLASPFHRQARLVQDKNEVHAGIPFWIVHAALQMQT